MRKHFQLLSPIIFVVFGVAVSPAKCEQQVVFLDFETVASGLAPITSFPWGSTFGPGGSALVDPDITVAGGGGLGGRASGSPGGSITIRGAIGTSIRFLYGATGNNPPSSGGFRGAARSAGLGEGAILYQGSTFNGFPAGPTTLTGPTAANGQFNSFTWRTAFSGGVAEIDNVELTVIPAVDILRNPASFSRNIDGSKLSVTFHPQTPAAPGTPATPVHLKDLAAALQVDHFNWLQTFSGPGNWTWQVLSGPEVSEIANNQNSIIAGTDPIANPTPLYDLVPQRVDSDRYVVTVDGDELNDVKNFVLLHATDDPNFSPTGDPIMDGPTADSKPFYYSEIPPYWDTQPEWVLAQDGSLNPYSLRFFDEPRIPDWALGGANGLAGDGFYLSFQTELVGVDRFGGIVHLFGTDGPGFHWRSNAVYRGDVTSGGVGRFGWLGQGHGNFGTPATSGGVSNFEFVGLAAVPEPASVVIMGSFLAVLLCVANRSVLRKSSNI